MKTNKLNVLLTAVSVGAIGLFVATEITAGILPAIPVTVSYIVIAVLLALVALDYRVGHKTYSAR